MSVFKCAFYTEYLHCKCFLSLQQVLSHKCLRDLTLEMLKAGEIVKKFPKDVISFLKELNLCIDRGFISWIKEIVKGKGLSTG